MKCESQGSEIRGEPSNAHLNDGARKMGRPTSYSGNEYSYYEVQLSLSGFRHVLLQFDFDSNFKPQFDRFDLQASTCPTEGRAT